MKRRGIEVLWLSVIIVALGTPIDAAEQLADNAGAFIQLGAGARASAMGGSSVAVAADATTAFWNPAGLPFLSECEAVFETGMLAVDRTHCFAAVTYNDPLLGGVGFSWTGLSIDGIALYDQWNSYVGESQDSENSFALCYGRQLVRRVSVGATVKYLYQTVCDRACSGFGGDVGLRVLPFRNLILGLLAQNLGTQVKWKTESGRRETVPLHLRVGASYQLDHSGVGVLIASDVDKREGQTARLHVGTQVSFREILALRLGSDQGRLTVGVGTRHGRFSVDYGYTDQVLGGAHTISLSSRIH
jgi:hypothetical protein